MDRDIAIIGMAGIFPEAENLAQFYLNLKNGRDSVRPLSRKRKANTTIPDHRDYQLLAYIEDIELFDYSFFKISLGEAQHMDPKQRLLLQVVYQTFENAGYNIDAFNGSNTSVYIGDTNLDYHKHVEDFNPTVITGNLNGLTAGRISRFFNLRGNSQMIDTACSSSLVALHQACNDLLLGESHYSLVCGVNLSLFPMHRREKFHDLDIVSPSGKAKSFSAEADGTGGGEAVISVLLKPLQQAREDNDIIHAVIKSTAVNQDANLSSSITAPDSVAQSEVIKSAWKKAQINPETIGYIEAHGTGTKLGDPIEVEGLDLAFKSFTQNKKICAISSVKTNIGHTDSAAGLAGLVKAVLSIKNKLLFPSLHFTNPNPFIDFENASVYVNSTLKEWVTDEKTEIRRAGVSSFGLTGTNCHVVLEEAPEEVRNEKEEIGCLITVSAKTSEALEGNIKLLADYIKDNENLLLQDISYTLTTGRKHYQYRYSIVAQDKEDLLLKLSQPEAGRYKTKVDDVAPKTIFVFSNRIKVSEEIIKSFLKYDTFKTAFENCLNYVQRDDKDNIYAFAFQYAFYKLLEYKGITSQFLIGDGTGKFVIAVLKGTLSLKAGIENALSYNEDSADLYSRLQKMIGKETADASILFLEMGPKGDVSEILSQLKKEKELFQLVRIQERALSIFRHFIKDLYLNNHPIDWQQFVIGESGRKIELPSYHFAKTRCWIKEPLQNKVEEWFYELNWFEQELTDTKSSMSESLFLMFSDKKGLGNEVAKVFEKNGNKCITVSLSDRFSKVSDYNFEIDKTSENDYKKLALSLLSKNLNGIISLQDFDSPVNVSDLDAGIINKLAPKVYILKAFNNYFNSKNFSLSFITANANKVTKTDTSNPLNSFSAGLIKSLLTEHITLKVSAIDFDLQDSLKSVAEKVYNEISCDDLLRIVSYRNSKRFIQKLSNLKINLEDFPDRSSFIRQGIYLVSGGTGGIALEICKAIAKTSKSHFIILGRRNLATSNSASLLDELISLNSTYEYHSVDISDKERMNEVFADLGRRYQKIQGVIHAAGIPGKSASVKDKSIQDFIEVLKPKVHGTVLLDKYTSQFQPQFFVLFSSLSVCVPHRNMADYVLANSFEDAYSMSKEGETTRYISINWPGWIEVGMSVKDGKSIENQYTPLAPMYVDDGVKAFEYALKIGKPNIAIANINISAIGVNPFFVVGDSAVQLEKTREITIQDSEKTSDDEGSESVESKVVQIWYDVLKSEQINREDDFFEIGGHSLNGAQVLNRIKKEFGLDLEIDDLLEYSTINSLTIRIEELLAKGQIEKFESIEPTPVKDFYDCSFGQKGLWMLSQMADGIRAFNMPGAFRFQGLLDKDALEKAFEALIERHESLRTTFIVIDGEPKQKVTSVQESGFTLRYRDLRAEENQEMKIARMMEEEANSIFDLEKGPLLRAQLIQLAEDQFVFLMTMHHIISDGWSMAILQKELQTLYQAFRQEVDNPLVPLRIQYRDYVVWQQNQLSGDRYHTHKSYWINKLGREITAQNLPTDFPRSAFQSFDGQRLYFTIDNILILEIRKRCSEENVTLFMFLLALVKTLIWKFSGNRDITIGSPIAGRSHQDLEDQIGYYLNALALRTKVHEQERFKDFLSKVKNTTVEAFQHDVYPFELLKEDLQLDNQFPLFRVLIMLQNTQGVGGKENKHDSLKINQMTVDYQASKFDLSFDFTETGNEVAGVIEYNTSLFSEETILKLKEGFLQITGKVSKDLTICMNDPCLEILKGELEEEKLLSFTMPIDDFIE